MDPITSSVYLLEDCIVNQMKDLDGGSVDKIDNHIERSHQDAKRLSSRFQCVTDFTQYQR